MQHIKAVAETNSTKMANEFLAMGWLLLSVNSIQWTDTIGDGELYHSAETIYILGNASANAPKPDGDKG